MLQTTFFTSMFVKNLFYFHFCLPFFPKTSAVTYIQHVNCYLAELDSKTWYGWTAIYWKTKLILSIKRSKYPSLRPLSKTLTSLICSWNYIYAQLLEEWCFVQRFVLYLTEEYFVTKELEDYFSVMLCFAKQKITPIFFA